MVNQRIRSYELSDFTRENEKTIKKMIKKIVRDLFLCSRNHIGTGKELRKT